jgi:hypothetical protein
MTMTITCECGAIYERAEKSVVSRDKDSFNCHICGHKLESWSGELSRIPVFKLMRRPETDTD